MFETGKELLNVNCGYFTDGGGKSFFQNSEKINTIAFYQKQIYIFFGVNLKNAP